MSTSRLPVHGMPFNQLLFPTYETLTLRFLARTSRASVAAWHKDCVSVGREVVERLWKALVSYGKAPSEGINTRYRKLNPLLQHLTILLDNS